MAEYTSPLPNDDTQIYPSCSDYQLVVKTFEHNEPIKS